MAALQSKTLSNIAEDGADSRSTGIGFALNEMAALQLKTVLYGQTKCRTELIRNVCCIPMGLVHGPFC